MRRGFTLSSSAHTNNHGPEKIDDSKIATIFESVPLTTGQECWIMHDYGVGRIAYLYRINIKSDYKYIGGKENGEKFIGAVFEGSNNLVTWT
jgi:hypothetical protein